MYIYTHTFIYIQHLGNFTNMYTFPVGGSVYLKVGLKDDVCVSQCVCGRKCIHTYKQIYICI